jgi:hypothetical protein
MQEEDALDLGDGFGVLVGSVAGGDNDFTFGFGEVAAPVGNEAV